MQFYISVMFLGLPEDKHEEKPSFLQFKKNALPTDRPTDGRTDGRTDGPTDGQTLLYRCEDASKTRLEYISSVILASLQEGLSIGRLAHLTQFHDIQWKSTNNQPSIKQGQWMKCALASSTVVAWWSYCRCMHSSCCICHQERRLARVEIGLWINDRKVISS